MTESIAIIVDRHRDPAGAATCCANWDTARCRFVVTRKLGFVEVCSATGADIQRKQRDLLPGEHAEPNRYDYLRPVDGCPVWPAEVTA